MHLFICTVLAKDGETTLHLAAEDPRTPAAMAGSRDCLHAGSLGALIFEHFCKLSNRMQLAEMDIKSPN